MALESINGMKVLDWDEIDAGLRKASEDYARLYRIAGDLASALERTETNMNLSVQGHPIRDMSETLAESASAREAWYLFRGDEC